MFCSKCFWVGLFGVVVVIVMVFYVSCGEVVLVEFCDLCVEVVGEGWLVLMIFGLNSVVSIWIEICVVLQLGVQCYIVQLFGFVGVLVVLVDCFMDGMCDCLLVYLDECYFDWFVVMGYSLGGVLVLQMVVERFGCIECFVIVDFLFFLVGLCGVMFEVVCSQVEVMCQQMMSVMFEQWEVGVCCNVVGMSCDLVWVECVVVWGLVSDCVIMVQVMVEFWGDDLCLLLLCIKVLIFVLGVWVVFVLMGLMLESMKKVFEIQYVGLDGVWVVMSQGGYYFLMWDDFEWLVGEVKGFVVVFY